MRYVRNRMDAPPSISCHRVLQRRLPLPFHLETCSVKHPISTPPEMCMWRLWEDMHSCQCKVDGTVCRCGSLQYVDAHVCFVCALLLFFRNWSRQCSPIDGRPKTRRVRVPCPACWAVALVWGNVTPISFRDVTIRRTCAYLTAHSSPFVRVGVIMVSRSVSSREEFREVFFSIASNANMHIMSAKKHSNSWLMRKHSRAIHCDYVIVNACWFPGSFH